MKNIIVFALLTVCLLISGCTYKTDGAHGQTASESTAADIGEKYTVNDIVGEYLCANEYYADYNFRDDCDDKLNVVFDADGRCSMRIHYIEGACTVYGTYTMESDKIHTEMNYDMTVMHDTESGENSIADDFVFTVGEDGSLTVDKGYYTVNAGDRFIKVSDTVQTVSDPDEDNPLLGTFVCESGYYKDNGAVFSSGRKPSFTFLKGGHCDIWVDNENSGGNICAEYRYDEKEAVVEKLRFTYGNEYPEALSELVPHEYIFEIADDGTLIIDRGFYKVVSGDRFVRESHENAG